MRLIKRHSNRLKESTLANAGRIDVAVGGINSRGLIGCGK